MLKNKYPACIFGSHRKDNKKLLKCYVCSVSNLWRNHQRTDTHLSNLWHFKKNFSDTAGDNFYCKLCDSSFSKDYFKRHAINGHKLTPWCNVAEELVLYFNNCIQLHEDIYCCHLCEFKTKRRHLILNHLDVESHQTNLEKYMPIKTEVILSLEFNKKFIVNSIFPYQSTQFKCWSCQCCFDGYEIAEEHISSESHENNLRKIKISPTEDCNNESTDDISIIEEDIDKQTKSVESTDNKFLQYFENYIGIQDDYFFCDLCQERFLTENSIFEHFKDEYHCSRKTEVYESAKKMKILENLHPKFYELCIRSYIFPISNRVMCILCSSKKLSYNDVNQHVNGKKHNSTHRLKLLPEVGEKKNIFDLIEDASEHKVKIDVTEDILGDEVEEESDEKKNELIGFNKFTVEEEKLVNEKIGEKKVSSSDVNKNYNYEVENALEYQFFNFFENHIFFRDDYQFCNLCERSFSSSSLTLVHINSDSNHKNRLRGLKERENSQKRKLPFTPNFYELLVRNNIFARKRKKFNCLVCEFSSSGTNSLEGHIDRRQHLVSLSRFAQVTANKSAMDGHEVIPDMQLVLPESKKDFVKYYENFIDKREKNYYCNLCKIEFPSSSTVKAHIDDDSEHINSVRRQRAISPMTKEIKTNFYCVELFVRNSLFQVNPHELRCFTCDKILLSLKGALNHPKGVKHTAYRNHLFSINSMAVEKAVNPLENSEKENEDINIEPPKIIEPKSSEPKYSSQESLARVSQPPMKKPSANQCSICRKKFRLYEDYFNHLTGHFWRHFRSESDITDLLTLVNRDSEVEISFIKTETNKVNLVPEGNKELRFSNKKSIPKSNYLWKKFKKDRKVGTDSKVKPAREMTMKHVDIDTSKKSKNYNIYEMDEELRHSIQLSFNRICVISKEEIYCMICRKSISFSQQEVYEHFRSVEHSYFLVQMVEDHLKFAAFPNEFSDLYLAREMIEDKSEHHVVCYSCNPTKPVAVPNNMSSLRLHIESDQHLHQRVELSRSLQDLVKICYLRLERNWLSIQKYWCVLCSKQFAFEKLFLRHLRSAAHKKYCDKLREPQRFIYDYCPACALLFFGYTRTYFYHSECKFHKFHLEKSINFRSRLSAGVEKLLAEADEVVALKLAKFKEEKSEMERNQELLVEDLKNTICEYVDAKIYLFGSRISGLGSIDSDLDIFLDCDDLYYKGSVADDVSFFLNEVEHSLKQNENIWTINKSIPNCRIPIIKVTHKLTNTECDISFTNGLAVENTKLVKKYIDAYPVCKQLILFMKDWLNICDLGGEDGICSYAVAWMVIYYLQRKFIVPEVKKLMNLREKSCVIAFWETGIFEDIEVSTQSNNFRFNDLLKGFFIMCADFDYRNNIMCPLLGQPVKKINFIRPKTCRNLPSEMNRYRSYIANKDAKLKCFRADAVFGVQDPFDLSHNLTKTVNKTTLNRFITYCKLSAEKLASRSKLRSF